MSYIQVALAVPLRKNFIYKYIENAPITIGARVRVPFGNRNIIGIIVSQETSTDFDIKKIKPITEILDKSAVLPPTLLQLTEFAARYYSGSHGQVLHQALPKLLRQGASQDLAPIPCWKCSEKGSSLSIEALSRSPKQQALLKQLQQQACSEHHLKQHGFNKTILKNLEAKEWITSFNKKWKPNHAWRTQKVLKQQPLTLNDEQQQAYDYIHQQGNQCTVLDGITGSGKTEVYLQVMADVLSQGKQVLVLVPEIGLTPQTVSRFEQRFHVPIVLLHSHLTDKQRLEHWQRAKEADAAIIIGTRSALFTPMQFAGLIIIDEEHDTSLKQQEGVRYHARDLAVYRAHLENIPIILGSATPSLETLWNIKNKRYSYIKLTRRAGQAQPVQHNIIDLRKEMVDCGISATLYQAIQQHLAQQQQVLLFLNRRGFAPALLCEDCGYLHPCQNCDAYYTVHKQQGTIQCHHCGDQRSLPHHCQQCHSPNIGGLGIGTEQLEAYLAHKFPHHKVVRLDRDSVRNKGELDERIKAIQNNDFHLIIGTQMLAKGHHFPNVTLVGVLDVDAALFSGDFRANEKFAQLYTQVAGRAGRAEKPGHVFLQTRQPDHPLLQNLIKHGYDHVAHQLIEERFYANLPPKQSMVLMRASSEKPRDGEIFLQDTARYLQQHQNTMDIIGPLPASMARKAGKFRHHLLLQTKERKSLQHFLENILPQIELLPSARRCQITIDRDPFELS